ncbi:hypothetical protein P6144_14935 [Sphingomonas sp. HITSZ_GF]|uniref:hypothetical protein n=1 Tax=Sphingomonas sp. HITSZ_GF TaxID=3037247 RepID=UPI00240E220E|nr:hypothetical protein [Sphingomonas sp. HITSZ_GF]MDG2534953.1 hypothetical protein [Sphingomonas sp. HITSZ_GF]
MKVIGLVAGFGWIASFTSPPGAQGDPRDFRHCRLSAVRTADNDIRLEQDYRSRPVPAPLPRAVADRIRAHVTAIARKNFTEAEWRETRMDCRRVFAPVFRLQGPDGLELYVAPRAFPLGNEVDYFLARDPRTGAVTQAPPLIFTKWASVYAKGDPLLGAPFVRMQPGSGGRRPTLTVEERTHNGNMYDAVVYRTFEIGKDMALKQVLAVEARAILMSDLKRYTERRATFLSPDRVRIDVTMHKGRKMVPAGSVLLTRRGAGEPFRIAERQVPEGLLTYCDSKRDDDFLRDGCDFYY